MEDAIADWREVLGIEEATEGVGPSTPIRRPVRSRAAVPLGPRCRAPRQRGLPHPSRLWRGVALRRRGRGGGRSRPGLKGGIAPPRFLYPPREDRRAFVHGSCVPKGS